MRTSGLTLVEILVALAILLLLAIGGTQAFTNFSRKETLEKTTAKVAAMIERARSMTLSAQSDSQYGIHFTTSQITFFQGGAYTSGVTTNEVLTLPASLTSSTLLTGGGSDLVFNRLSGMTTQSGTTTISVSAVPTLTKTLVIYKTGLIERR